MARGHRLGRRGEAMAAAYLLEQGYRILARNWRHHHKELDIVAEKGEVLVIVEVKTREDPAQPAGELVPPEKEHALIEAADAFIRQHDLDEEVRFDVIIITMPAGGAPTLEHIPGAFYPTL